MLQQNRYRIDRLLGEGGQGAVYQASDTRLSGKRVAIKEMFSDDAVSSRAFEREAALLANLDHPTLPDVSDYFQEESSCFLVMEFIEGNTLSDLMGIKDKTGKGEPLPLESVLKWADDLLDALDYMHTQQEPVIHKDIKPQNIAVAKRNKVMLLDFGLAKGAVGEITAAQGTLLHGFSPWYASPEQILRLRFGPFYDLAESAVESEELERMISQETDARSDLYSLAATLYHCLTGAPPPVSVIRLVAISQSRPDPLRPANEVNPQIAPAIASVLTQAMMLNRKRRFSSAAAMRKALDLAHNSTAIQPAPNLPLPPEQVEEVTPVSDDAGQASSEAQAEKPSIKPPDRRVKNEEAISPFPPHAAPIDEREAVHVESKPDARKIWLAVAGVLVIAAITIVVIWALRSKESGTITPPSNRNESPPPASPEMREALSYYLEVADDRGGSIVNKRRSAGSESATAYH